MKIVRLKTLVLENFKCHDYLSLDLGGEDARILGDNAAGKTSIYDGLCWLLFGKDSLGNGNPEVKPLNAQGEPRDPYGVTQVTAVLLVDGRSRELRRTLHGVWTTDPETARKHFQGNTSEYFADGVPCRKGEFQQKVEAIAREEEFRLLTGIGQFAEGLSWQKRREILFDLSHTLGDRELMLREERFRPLASAAGDCSLEELHRKLLSEKKALKEAKTDLPPRISELERTVLQLGAPDFESLRARRQVLQGMLEALQRKDPEEGEKLRQLQRINLDLRDLNQANEAHRQVQQQKGEALAQKLRYARNQLRQQEDPEVLRETWKALEATLEKVQNEEFQGDCCPYCGQLLPEKAREEALHAFEKEKQEKILKLRNQISDAQGRQGEAQQARQNLTDQIRGLEGEKKVQKILDLPGFAEKKARLEMQISGLQEEASGDKKDQKQEDLRRSLEALDRELGKQGVLELTRNRVQKLRGDMEEVQARMRENERLLLLYEEFGRYKVRLTEETVSSHFRLARFRLYRPTIGGGFEERCDVMVDGIPYSSLNTGARINVGLDIIETLSRHYGVSVPLFLDNAESVTRPMKIETQMIRLQVTPGQSEIRIERHSGC